MQNIPDIEHFPFTFDKLEEFELSTTDVTDDWIEIITQLKSLKKLDIKSHDVTVEQWLRIINELIDLVEVAAEISDEEDFSSNVIASMEKHKKLQKVTFKELSLSSEEYLCETIDRNWELVDGDDFDTCDTVIMRINDIEAA